MPRRQRYLGRDGDRHLRRHLIPGSAVTTDGLLAGNAGQLLTQLIAVVACGGYAFLVTAVLLKVLDATMGLRVTHEEELAGLDISQHGEVARRR